MLNNRHSQHVPISEIRVIGRFRKDLGDIDSLAASIKRVGLLHPIVVTPERKLVVGLRRVEAFKKLGKTEIPANIAKNFTDLSALLKAQRDENTCRKDYLPQEGYNIGIAIAKAYRPKAEEANVEGGKKAGRGRPLKKAGENCPSLSRDESKRTNEVAAKAAGFSRRTFEKIGAIIESGDKNLIDEMNHTRKVDGVYKKMIIAEKAEKIRLEPPPMPKGPFRVIVVDPPWRYDLRNADPSHQVASPYPSLCIADIKKLQIKSVSCKDSILWLWSTNAHLPDAFEIVKTWGFEFKTMLTWGKTTKGMGDWLRGQTEHCLMCIRGKPLIQLTNQSTLLIAAKSRHSKKPEEFYKMIEKMCPGSKLEMYQRRPRKGWTGHGDEV
jgi:N6-adenosine-specific RNA methylase IME4